MSKRRIGITDHAVLRYLERVRGLDVDAVRAEMADRVAFASEHPGCTAVVSSGWRYRIRNGVVVTVTGVHWSKGARTKP
jgi:hypothetical protein